MIRTILILAIALGVVRWCSNAHANDVRFQKITYNEQRVTKVYGQFGIHTLIVFGERESIKTVAVGFSKAWEVTPLGNKLTVKLRQLEADTNMTVVTETDAGDRLYHFDLLVHPGRGVVGAYQITFDYPQDRARASAQKDMSVALKRGTGKRNVTYSVEGDESMRPVSAWDDGIFTYFLFTALQDVPAIYAVDPDGNESILNMHSPRVDVFAVQKIGRKFVLRRGDAVACVFNDGPMEHAPSIGTGTTSPEVRRVVR